MPAIKLIFIVCVVQWYLYNLEGVLINQVGYELG